MTEVWPSKKEYEAALRQINQRLESLMARVGGEGGGGAPADAKYIVQALHADLSAEQSLGALATGVVKNTANAGVGVLSTFVLTISDAAASGGNDGDIWLEY